MHRAIYGLQWLIKHWNGTQWSVVSAPAAGTFSTQLYDVSAVTDADVRTVGGKQDNVHNPRTLVEDGQNGSFSLQNADSIGSGENHLYGLQLLPTTWLSP